jgi:hypothetical protein
MIKIELTRRQLLMWLGGVVALLVVLIGAYTFFTLTWAYSRGERAGYVQKFSQRGWLCKTWEGELAMVNVPGALQERFEFTVRDDLVAQHLLGSMGKRVTVTYDQHKGVPTSCFGETEYFVTAVKVLE